MKNILKKNRNVTAVRLEYSVPLLLRVIEFNDNLIVVDS